MAWSWNPREKWSWGDDQGWRDSDWQDAKTDQQWLERKPRQEANTGRRNPSPKADAQQDARSSHAKSPSRGKGRGKSQSPGRDNKGKSKGKGKGRNSSPSSKGKGKQKKGKGLETKPEVSDEMDEEDPGPDFDPFLQEARGRKSRGNRSQKRAQDTEIQNRRLAYERAGKWPEKGPEKEMTPGSQKWKQLKQLRETVAEEKADLLSQRAMFQEEQVQAHALLSQREQALFDRQQEWAWRTQGPETRPIVLTEGPNAGLKTPTSPSPTSPADENHREEENAEEPAKQEPKEEVQSMEVDYGDGLEIKPEEDDDKTIPTPTAPVSKEEEEARPADERLETKPVLQASVDPNDL